MEMGDYDHDCAVLQRECSMGQGSGPPQPLFSPGMIFLEKIFGDCPLSSFNIDMLYLGTS